jgi:hypothetical protein
MSEQTPSAQRLRRLFLQGFSVMDIAEPLCSFDAETSAAFVRDFLETKGFDLVGIRKHGLVAGYGVREELFEGELGAHLHSFEPDDLVADEASLAETIQSLHANGRCFVSSLGHVGFIVTFDDLEKPPVRMWLFGMVTILEMAMSARLRKEHPDDSWVKLLSPERCSRANELWNERLRRGRICELSDCLQFADKATILLKTPGRPAQLGFASKRKADDAFAEFQSLRNSLAHTQEIISSDWQAVVRLAGSLGQLLRAV